MLWKYVCSSDSHVPMTTIVLGDIGGDMLTTHIRVARIQKNTRARTHVVSPCTFAPSQLDSTRFAPKSISILLLVFVLFFQLGRLSFLKFPQVK